MAAPLSVTAHIELAALATHLSELERILDAAAEIGPCASVPALVKKVAQKTQVEESDVLRVINALTNLRNFHEQVSSSESVQESLNDLLKIVGSIAEPDWKSQYLSVLQSNAGRLANILSGLDEDHAVFVSAKARDLGYSHDNLLVSSRIITDARPVFDKEGKKILATVIGQSLCIQYTDGLSSPRLITFALDSEDIESLRSACERAVEKARILAKEFSKFNPAILPGT